MIVRELNDILNEFSPGWTADTDAAPAINQAFAQGTARILKNPGVHTIASTVNTGGKQIEGFGITSNWKVNMAQGVAFQHYLPGGGIKGCSFDLAVPGDTLTYCINVSGDAATQGDQSNFSDLYITSTHQGYWWTAFQINGLAREHPIGTRVVQLENIQCFNSHSYGMAIMHGVQVYGCNIGIWTGKTPELGGSLYEQDSWNTWVDDITCSYVYRVNPNGGRIDGQYINKP